MMTQMTKIKIVQIQYHCGCIYSINVSDKQTMESFPSVRGKGEGGVGPTPQHLA